MTVSLFEMIIPYAQINHNGIGNFPFILDIKCHIFYFALIIGIVFCFRIFIFPPGKAESVLVHFFLFQIQSRYDGVVVSHFFPCFFQIEIVNFFGMARVVPGAFPICFCVISGKNRTSVSVIFISRITQGGFQLIDCILEGKNMPFFHAFTKVAVEVFWNKFDEISLLCFHDTAEYHISIRIPYIAERIVIVIVAFRMGIGIFNRLCIVDIIFYIGVIAFILPCFFTAAAINIASVRQNRQIGCIVFRLRFFHFLCRPVKTAESVGLSFFIPHTEGPFFIGF